jgi:hypothetical protein
MNIDIQLTNAKGKLFLFVFSSSHQAFTEIPELTAYFSIPILSNQTLATHLTIWHQISGPVRNGYLFIRKLLSCVSVFFGGAHFNQLRFNS